jgi:hypothetical protein
MVVFEKYRELRDNGIEDSLQYVETLGAYAADKKYFPKLKSIIKMLRTEYDIPQLNRTYMLTIIITFLSAISISVIAAGYSIMGLATYSQVQLYLLLLWVVR